MAETISCDVAIAGAGLAGGLIALALAERHPGLDVRLVDAGNRVGGNHLWSFFAPDIAPADRWIVEPLIGHRWDAHSVAFPGYRRRFEAPYHSIESETLDAHVRAALPAERLILGRRILAVSPTTIVLADGGRVAAGGVIDARGAGDLSNLDLGYQKFVGRELTLARPHGLDAAEVMDASVEQIGGYRFVYVLPFDERRVFVEDTYYTNGPALDVVACHARIDAYAAARGWQVTGSARAETGVLPVAFGGDFDAYWRSGGARVAKAGMRAGLFHPLTGYSLPDAVRTAAALAAAARFDAAGLLDLTYAQARRTWDERGFYRLLTRLLFRAGDPTERRLVFDRFYRLDRTLIERFYAGRSTLADQARVLVGKPPVPFIPAVGILFDHLAGARDKGTP